MLLLCSRVNFFQFTQYHTSTVATKFGFGRNCRLGDDAVQSGSSLPALSHLYLTKHCACINKIVAGINFCMFSSNIKIKINRNVTSPVLWVCILACYNEGGV
jgi:hypothetical protein